MKYKPGIKTKDLILKCAFDLIAKQGYESASIQQIMDKVGRSKAVFYSHFKTKEDMMVELIDKQVFRNYEKIKEDALNYMASKTYNCQEFFRYLYTVGLSLNDRKEWTIVFNELVRLSLENEQIRSHLQQARDHWLELGSLAIQEGKKRGQLKPTADEQGILEAFLALYEGAQSMKMYGKEPNLEKILPVIDRIVQ